MANRFATMKAQAEVLERIDKLLNEIIQENSQSYEVIGKSTEQAKDWRTGELKWEDEEHTIPKFCNEYGYVQIPDDKLTDEQRITKTVCEKFQNRLEKLIG